MDLTATRGRRRLLFGALYLSQGAPIGFLWWALPTQLRARGVPVEKITALTALLILPWLFKFAWAPLVDTLRGDRFGYRHWIVSAQIAMGLTLLPLAILDLQSHFTLLTGLLLLHAFAAATQDVAIDGWAIGITPVEERGRITGAMQGGMLLGRWLFGSGLLLAGPALGRGASVAALIAAVWFSAALIVISRDAVPQESAGRTAALPRLARFTATLKAAFSRRSTWLGLWIAGVGGAGFEAIGAVAGPFLIDRGLRPAQVGAFYTASAAAMFAGSWAGGAASDRFGRRRSVAAFLLFLAAAGGALAASDDRAGSPALLMALLVTLYLGIGLFVAASYALFMDLTQPEIAGTQFSTFMGATNGCESWSSFAVGRLIGRLGYPPAFAIMAGLSLLALPALAALERTVRPRSPGEERVRAS